jgi:hypothetical protein
MIAWARAVGDAMHRLANDLVGVPTPAESSRSSERKLSKTEYYYDRQARFLGSIIDRGGSVTIEEGRTLARDAGIGKGWQVYWRPNSLLERKGNRIKITEKGKKRYTYAQDYLGRSGGEVT